MQIKNRWMETQAQLYSLQQVVRHVFFCRLIQKRVKNNHEFVSHHLFHGTFLPFHLPVLLVNELINLSFTRPSVCVCICLYDSAVTYNRLLLMSSPVFPVNIRHRSDTSGRALCFCDSHSLSWKQTEPVKKHDCDSVTAWSDFTGSSRTETKLCFLINRACYCSHYAVVV